MSLEKIEQGMMRQSGKFFGEANEKFAGRPKGLLQKTEERVERFREERM